jgi:YYY domain-containing protein
MKRAERERRPFTPTWGRLLKAFLLASLAFIGLTWVSAHIFRWGGGPESWTGTIWVWCLELLPGTIDPKVENINWATGKWGILARPISALCGTLTLLYIYRIGARIYDRRVGLLAAILLTFTVLHIQLSHFYTFDVILAFFTTAAVYSLLVFIDATTPAQRWRAILGASIWTGLAMSTKFGGILLFVPWLVAFIFAFLKGRPMDPVLSLSVLVATFVSALFALAVFGFMANWLDRPFLTYLVSVLVVAVVLGGILWWLYKRNPRTMHERLQTIANAALLVIALVAIGIGMAEWSGSAMVGLLGGISLYALVLFLEAVEARRRVFWACFGLASAVIATLLFAWSALLFPVWVGAFFVRGPAPAFLWKFHLRTLNGYLQFPLLAAASWAVIWSTTFLTQPFGYLDYNASSKETTLSFVHFDPSALPKGVPAGVKAGLESLGTRLNPFTRPWGFHFGPLLHPDSRRPFPDAVAVGGGKYWRDVDEQRRMATQGGVPWTRQYEHTLPIIYQWKNLIFYGMGFPLGVLCFLGLFFGFGHPFMTVCWKEWLVWVWMAINFFPTHFFHTKFPRYLAPELPFFCLWGAALAVFLYRHARRRASLQPLRRNVVWKLALTVAVIATVTWSALYSHAFIGIYTGDHTWTTASKWFDEEVPAGKKIQSEVWDDSVPWDGRVFSKYQAPRAAPNPVHSPEPGHMRGLLNQLIWGDYYSFSSKRNYGAFLQAADNSDPRVLFYKNLFAGNFGYELVKTFSQPVYVLGIPIRFELADESLSLYDHPTVHVFKKVEKLELETLEDRLYNPPRWVAELTPEQVLTATEDRPILADRTDFDPLIWILAVLLVGWVFWPLAALLFPASPDRGFFASKTLGILILTFTVWFGASVGWWTNTRLVASAVFFLWALMSLSLGWSRRGSLCAYCSSKWKLILCGELLFLAVLGYFLFIKAHNPDIHWGEKPMDASFLNAAYKTETFPAEDPWFAGVPINYYYYGQTVVGLFGKWIGVSPDYAYNLSVATWPALVFILIFGMVYNLTRSRLGGVIAGFLATMAGNGKAYFQLAGNLRPEGGLKEPKIFREQYVPQEGLTGYLGDAWGQIWEGIKIFPEVFTDKVLVAFQSFLAGFSEESLQAAEKARLPHLISFDGYFWKLSRISQSTVANEFPVWSALFADLHAHLLVMPFGMLFLSLAVGYCQRKAALWEMRAAGNVAQAVERYGGPATTLAQVVALGFVFGAVQVTNTWDMPGLGGFLFIALALTFASHFKSWGRTAKWRLWRSHARLQIAGQGLRRLSFLKFGFLQEVLLPFVGVAVLSRALFTPFYRAFSTPTRVTGIGWMHEAASGWKTPYEMVQIFGPILVFVLVGVWMLYWRWGASERRGGWKVLTGVLGSVLLVGVWALYMRGVAAETFTPTPGMAAPAKGSLEFWQYLDHDIAYVMGAFFLALLILLFPFLFGRRIRLETRLGALILSLGLAIVAGCEVVYIKEGWGPPSHQWNTVFKLHLQAWLCLSVGVGWLLGVWWTPPEPGMRPSARIAGRVGRWVVGYPLLLAGLLFAAVFPLMAPYLFAQAEGFRGRSRQFDNMVTLDGLAYLKRREPDVAAAIEWLRRETEGTPVILEAAGEGYQHDTSRFSTFTGLPTLIGWPHHSSERGNVPPPRVQDVRVLYTDSNRERVRDLLMKYEVRYVVVGPKERALYSAGAGRGLKKFEEWDDLFDRVFQSNRSGQEVSIYEVHPRYELLKDWRKPEAEKAPTLFQESPGLPLLAGSEGTQPGQYREPRGLAVGPEGQIAVADTFNHRIQGFAPGGQYQWEIGGIQGSEPGEFNEPSDVAYDSTGRLFVLDTWNSRVQIFSATGAFEATIDGFGGGSRGVHAGPVPQDGDPTAGAGPAKVLVANTPGGDIQVFDLDGKRVGRWGVGEAGGFEPVDIEPTPLGFAVADSRQPRVVFFDGRGTVAKSWPLPMEPTGDQTNEIKLAWHPQRDLLLVTDPSHNHFYALDREGQVAFETPLAGTPTGIAVAPNGTVYATLRGQHRVTIVGIPQ